MKMSQAHDVVALLANDDVVALLADRTRVLSPRKDHEFFCGIIDDNADGEQSLIAQSRGHRLVRFADKSSAYYAVPEARLVPLEGYADRLLDGCEQRGGEASFYSVWRSEIWVEGLFSLVFWALGFLESEAQRCEPGTRLLIDWSDEEILFHGGRTPHNAWNHFFEQPPAVDGGTSSEPTAAEINKAIANNNMRLVSRFGPPRWFRKFGDFRGADEGRREEDLTKGVYGGGRLDEASAAKGRKACSRWLRVRPKIRARAEALAASQLKSGGNGRWLAVHTRRTDKMQQCAANHLGTRSIVTQAIAFCKAMGLGGVFLCTDDLQCKATVAAELRAAGVAVAMLQGATLSKGRNQPSHKDEELDRRANAEDCLVEVLVMSKCDALLCSWSNVSVAVVYFAREGFPWFMFGDRVPEAVQQQRAPPTPALSSRRPSRGCREEWRVRRRLDLST